MSFFKESFTTLRLFLWFVALLSAAELIGIATDLFHRMPFSWWLVIDVPLDTAVALGAGYLALNIKTLIPRYTDRVIKIIWITFLIEIGYSLLSLALLFINPSANDPALSEPGAIIGGLAGSVIGLGFAYLIYAVIVTNIRRLSTGTREEIDKKTSRIYWAIFILLLALVFGALLYDSGTGSFTT